MRISRQFLKQLIFYGLVGGTTLLIDVSVTTALYELLHFPVYLASGIGFLSGFFFNFPMNRKKVFRHDENDRFIFKTQIILYACLSIFNLLATSLLTQVLVSTVGLKIVYAKICVTAIISVWNFIIFKTFIFAKTTGDKKDQTDERMLNDII